LRTFQGESGMQSTRLGIAALAVSLLGVYSAAESQVLSEVQTSDLRLLYFHPTETYLVPRVIQTFHGSLERQRSILGYEPTEKTTILLKDFSDYGNAGASAVPANAVIVDIAPIPLTFETTAPAERMYTLMNHEMVHISTTDQPAASDIRYRRLLGGKVLPVAEHPETILYQYLTAPRKSSPRWYLEGIAVFMETWMAGGLGRAQGPYDEMKFRSMVRDGAHFYDPLGLVAEGVAVDFQVGANAYLYGGRFMSYLAFSRSPDMLIEWIKRTDDSERSYAREFERVFGLPLDDAWQEWIAWEHDFQRQNLGKLRQFPITPHEDLADSGLGSVSRAYYDPQRNSLVAGIRYPGVVAHVGEYSLDTKQVRHLEDIKVPMVYRVTSLAYDPATETAFYTADNYAYRDLMSVDVNTGKARMLLHDARIGEIVFNAADRSIWGIRHLNGYVSLVRIPYPYEEWNLVHSFSYGTLAYDLDISPDGTLLSGSFGDIQGNQSIRTYRLADLLDERVEPVHEFDFGLAVPEGFVFSPDGRFLFGSSYYTGVSNIFRYELETGELDAVSNSETGLFRPIPLDNETLIAFRYSGDGLRPTRLVAEPVEDVAAVTFLGTETIRKHPQLKDWQVHTGSEVSAESLIVSEGKYVPAKNLGLESVFPVVLGYKDSVSLGVKANFSDPIRLDTFGAAVSYSLDSDLPGEERPNIALDYRHSVVSDTPLSGVWRLGARLNYADFYDLFGPTKQSRKGYRFLAGYDKTLIYDKPRKLEISTELNHYADIDALPRYQDVPASIDKLTSFDARLGYSHVRRSLGAVDDEKGIEWNFATSINHVDRDTIPKIGGNFDFGFALPMRNSSIWFRNAAGAAFGEQTDEFANFYFGGFGNNYVDRGIVKRYREFYAFPGFELNAIPGRNFYRGMLEWNLPPLRFSRVGTPRFYLSNIRPAIFASSLHTNIDDSAARIDAANFGTQFDLQFTVNARYDMTLSIGYAAGYLEGSRNDDEFMVSLKIL
jgi:hypothetical protein